MKRIGAALLALLIALVADALPRVYIVNMYPGEEIYQLEGHTALVVADSTGVTAYNYGVFDFDSPNFVWRFVKGETDYMLAAYPFVYLEMEYRREGRRAVAHEIDMDSVQTVRLLGALRENLQPQNRVYRYNYVKDNCATRPLRIVELAMGDSIILPAAVAPMPLTFREAMRLYHKDYPWYQLGIDLALGSGIDYELDAREMAFSPMLLDSQLPAARTASGAPLLRATRTLLDFPPATLGPTPWPLRPGPVLWALCVLVAAACFMMARRRKAWRWLYCAFYAAMALVGCVMAFLVLVSTHEATSPNYLLLFFNPLCAIPAIFIWLKKWNGVVFWYEIANFAVIIAGSVLWPLMGQAFNAALAPVVLADALLAATYIYISRAASRPH